MNVSLFRITYSHLTVLSIMLLTACAPLQVTRNNGDELAFIKQAAERALDFTEGNIASLNDARDDFTPDGWRSFVKQAVSSDERGAPQFSSRFTPSEDAKVISDKGDTVRIGIGGILKQSQRSSTTNYQAVIYVQLESGPRKISSLEISTCGGSSTSKPCPVDMDHKFPLSH